MDCFQIKSNNKIQILLDEFHENIKDVYPAAYSNYKSSQIQKVAGWPCPRFDLVMIYYEIGYDDHHPLNRYKEVEMQTGEIFIQGVLNKFEFSGSRNIIDRFRFPEMFHKSFEFDEIKIQNELKPIRIANARARKKFKNSLKKDIKEYEKIINYENLFLTNIKGKKYLSIAEIVENKYLSYDKKYNACILEYKEPKELKNDDGKYSIFNEMSTIINLDKNINDLLRGINTGDELKTKIKKIANISK